MAVLPETADRGAAWLHFTPRWMKPRPAPITPQQAERLDVEETVLDAYAERYGLSATEAAEELRELARAAVETGRCYRQRGGAWRLLVPEGYGLVVTRDGTAIARYETRHAERSYRQVLDGVRSRSGSREKAWVRRLNEELDPPVRVTRKGATEFSREVLGTDCNAENADAVFAAVCEALPRVLEPWPKELGTYAVRDPETGLWWFLDRQDEDDRGALVAVRGTPDWT